jgi:3-hydroxyisobutyrate dehydrogenase-like beta-hydroxyacid dehydrogenase
MFSKAGYELTVWNRSAEKCEPFSRKAAHLAKTLAEAARDADLIV